MILTATISVGAFDITPAAIPGGAQNISNYRNMIEGNSITNGAGCGKKVFVFLEDDAGNHDCGYTNKISGHTRYPGLPPNSAPAISPTKGIFAPQGMKAVVIIVIRSRSCSMVRDAMIPGHRTSGGDQHRDEALTAQSEVAEQAVHDERHPRHIRHPQAAQRVNRINICGRKPSTDPIMPSVIRSISQLATSQPQASV